MMLGNKNRDDFHCMQMRLVMSMWFIFGDDLSDKPSWSRFGFLAMMQFSPNQDHWVSCIHTLVLKSKYPEELSTIDNVVRENIIAGEILFRVVLRQYVSQNIAAITGTLQLNNSIVVCIWLIDFRSC